MSFTLRGRLETRVAASLLPLLLSCILTIAIDAWWPVELAALMLAIGLALDTEYDRLLPYQPGWYALPLGLLELALVLGAARLLHVMAPFWEGLAFYAAAWLVATAVSQALLPLLRLSFADDGGELGLAGPTLAAGASVVLAGAAGLAFTTQRPTLHLSRGVHQGPLVIDRAEDVVGEPGAVVRGGIVIRSSHVTVRHVTVVGGTNGISVQGARHVTLADVRVSGFRQDGIHVRQSQVMVMDCSVTAGAGTFTQGIDLSYTGPPDQMSMVEDCEVSGVREGIVTHYASASLVRNRVSETALRGIAMTEMSMGDVTENVVTDGVGVGILCGDHSMCTLKRNVVAGLRADPSGIRSQRGIGIYVQFYAEAEVDGNRVGSTPGGMVADAQSTIFGDKE
jgi:nitrous oxidase accessory protein NosD